VASVTAMKQAWDARDQLRHTSDVQLRIDRIGWHLVTLQRATQDHALDSDPAQATRFGRLRDDVDDDLAQMSAMIADDPFQQQRVVALGAAFVRYFANLESIFAAGAGQDIDRNLALATTAEVARVSSIVTEMRDHEDRLLAQRRTRADTLLAVLLPTLSFAAAVIAFLVVFIARSIVRALRERETVLSEKDGELAAKDIMMREVDHRVRNSLNLIYSLMTFQQRKTASDSAARGLLAEAANQVLVVARVHERLYKFGSTEALDLGEYLRALCSDLAILALPAESQAAIRLQSPRAQVRAEQAVWIGLIVVELITNALKYASPSLQSPITIDVSPDEKELRIVVADGGAGLPADFDLNAGKGLGMQVVLLLVRQLHATLEVDPAWSGSRFILTMPLTTGSAP
jgi:two-component sensor histidine kinase